MIWIKRHHDGDEQQRHQRDPASSDVPPEFHSAHEVARDLSGWFCPDGGNSGMVINRPL
jgi:hypothetical protein